MALTWLQLPSTQALATAAGRSRASSAKRRAHGERLQVKGRQGVLQVQYQEPSSKEHKLAVQWHQPEKQGFFSFGSFDVASEERGLELLVDSGCNGFMLKDRPFFEDLNDAFNIDVGNGQCQRESNRSLR